MSISALNKSLAMLNALAVRVPESLQIAKSAIDQHGAPSPNDQDQHVGAAGQGMQSATGGGLSSTSGGAKPGGALPMGIFAAGRAVGAEIAKQIEIVATKQTKEISDAGTDLLKSIKSSFDVRDKGLQETLDYINTRASAGYTGSKALENVVNILSDMKKASLDPAKQQQLLGQLRNWLHVINDLLIGKTGTQGGLDINRLLGAFGSNNASSSRLDSTSAATSTGHAP